MATVDSVRADIVGCNADEIVDAAISTRDEGFSSCNRYGTVRLQLGWGRQ